MAAAAIFAALALLTVQTRAVEEVKLYTGYKLIRVKPVTPEQVEYLEALQDDESFPFKLDFWGEPFLNKQCDINVPPDATPLLLVQLEAHGLKSVIIQQDVQELIDSTVLKDKVASLLVKNGLTDEIAQQTVSQPDADKEWLTGKMNNLLASLSDKDRAAFEATSQMNVVGVFPRHANINNWLDHMVEQYPSLASSRSIGRSFENKDMRVIKVGKTTGVRKPVIWVDAAIHAREWLSVGTIIHIINKLLTSYGVDLELTDLLDTYDWYFLPVANPDGYEYSHTSDRLWRKTRSKLSPTLTCAGADPNRNFDFKWRVSGTSPSACADTYAGPWPFSEVETQNMRDAINGLKSNMKLYISLHSYNQLWLTPWAYGSEKPVDNADLVSVATSGEAALRSKYGTPFTVGAPPDILYAASGGAYDWVKGVAGVKYAYTLELRPDENDANGFIVSENQISPSGEEVWAGLAKVAGILKTRN